MFRSYQTRSLTQATSSACLTSYAFIFRAFRASEAQEHRKEPLLSTFSIRFPFSSFNGHEYSQRQNNGNYAYNRGYATTINSYRLTKVWFLCDLNVSYFLLFRAQGLRAVPRTTFNAKEGAVRAVCTAKYVSHRIFTISHFHLTNVFTVPTVHANFLVRDCARRQMTQRGARRDSSETSHVARRSSTRGDRSSRGGRYSNYYSRAKDHRNASYRVRRQMIIRFRRRINR